jgi:ABC-type sugar transport system substrate-binding protein
MDQLSRLRIRRTLGSFAAGVLAMTFAAVGTAGASATPGAATPKANRSLVYFIFTGYTPPYFSPMATGINAAAKKYRALNIKTLAANGSASTEVSDIKEAVAAGAKGIILNPIDNSVTSAAQQAMKSGVPVVTIDRDIASASGRIAFIGDKDLTLGKEQTSYGLSWLAKQGFKKPWNVVILQGTLGSSTAIDRLSGAMAALKPYISNKSVKVVLSQSANFDTGSAQTLMTEELAKTTNIQLVIAGNDAMALGAVTAFKTHGITPGKKVGIVGADAQPESLSAIKAGTQLDTVTHSPYVEAFWAVETLSRYLSSHKKPANPIVTIPMTVVTKANVANVTGWGTPKVVPALP